MKDHTGNIADIYFYKRIFKVLKCLVFRLLVLPSSCPMLIEFFLGSTSSKMSFRVLHRNVFFFCLAFSKSFFTKPILWSFLFHFCVCVDTFEQTPPPFPNGIWEKKEPIEKKSELRHEVMSTSSSSTPFVSPILLLFVNFFPLKICIV